MAAATVDRTPTSSPASLPTSTTQPTGTERTLNITVEFTGGLEILFNNVAKHRVALPANLPPPSSSQSKSASPTTIGYLIKHLLENLLQDPRKELFVVDGAVRPGILVLINDADWELEGEDKYELKDGDNVLFVSTLHGG